MKTSAISFLTFLMVALLAGCGQKSESHEEHEEEAAVNDANGALYDQVMKVHDEVMPKLGTIERLIEELNDKIANTPEMTADEKSKTEATIAKLDSAGQGMRNWMHEFNPPADSLGEEVVREYLESEMERIRRVKEDMLEALDEAAKQE